MSNTPSPSSESRPDKEPTRPNRRFARDEEPTTIPHVPRVLIIEDMVELGEVIQTTLERMELMAFCETSGTRALERYEAIEPDLVLLDIGLPDMTGWKVLDAIKEGKAIYRRPVIIMLTAYGDPANRLMGKLQGVDHYLIKPFTPEEIENVVREALSKKQQG